MAGTRGTGRNSGKKKSPVHFTTRTPAKTAAVSRVLDGEFENGGEDHEGIGRGDGVEHADGQEGHGEISTTQKEGGDAQRV